MVLLYPSPFGRLARTRYWLRRTLALTHSAVEWVLTLPATVLLLHRLPHLSATVDPVIIDTDVSWTVADWARHTLVGRLAADPTLDGWTVLVFAHLALLRRPPDRWAPPVDEHHVGYLATVVDDSCPPA